MNKIDKTRPIFTELVIGLMFFLISSALLLRLFGLSYGQARKTGYRNAALNTCENVIDTLMASSDPEATLTELGFDESGVLNAGDYRLTIEAETKPVLGGSLFTGTITAGTATAEWFSLPVSVCSEVQP